MSMQRICELHIASARRAALDLAISSTAILPVEWKDTYTEEATIKLIDFAFHSYRITELCSITNAGLPEADIFLMQFSANAPTNVEKRFDYAINLIRHAKEFSFGYAHSDHRKLFLASEANLTPTYVKASNAHGVGTVSIFGVTHCFLNGVIPIVKRKFPQFRF